MIRNTCFLTVGEGLKNQKKLTECFQGAPKDGEDDGGQYGISRVGILLLPIFFPNGLRPYEIEWQRQVEAKYDQGDRQRSEDECSGGLQYARD